MTHTHALPPTHTWQAHIHKTHSNKEIPPLGLRKTYLFFVFTSFFCFVFFKSHFMFYIIPLHLDTTVTLNQTGSSDIHFTHRIVWNTLKWFVFSLNLQDGDGAQEGEGVGTQATNQLFRFRTTMTKR